MRKGWSSVYERLHAVALALLSDQESEHRASEEPEQQRVMHAIAMGGIWARYLRTVPEQERVYVLSLVEKIANAIELDEELKAKPRDA